MKKPLYYLDNYEKKRILEMHQTATKKQYINENKQLLREFWWWVIGGAAVLGGGYALYNNWRKGSGKDTFNQLHAMCSKPEADKAKKYNTAAEHKQIANDLKKAFDWGAWYTAGFGTDNDLVKSSLAKIKSIGDYCAVAKEFKSKYNLDLASELQGEITTSFKEYVMDPLESAVKKSGEDEENAKKNNGGGKDDEGRDDEGRDDEDFSEDGDKDSDKKDETVYKVCMNTFEFGCKDTDYTHEVKEIQKCLGLKETGKFDSKTRGELKSQFGKEKINSDEIPLLCGNF